MTEKGKQSMDPQPRYSVVVVHGITGASGKTQAGFSKELASRVIPTPACRDKFWHEAVWEGVFDALDERIKKVVIELIGTYDFKEYFRKRLEKAKGVGKILPRLGLFAAPFANHIAPGLVREILDYALDLPLYLGNAYGRQIRAKVAKEIRSAAKQAEGVVVVGHSLGSLIAHDVVAKLLAQRNPPAIKALVTMGSPLEWVEGLRKEQKDAPVIPPLPPSLKWLNFYNKIDPVPLKKKLSTTIFPGVENIETVVPAGKERIAHSAYWTDNVVAGRIKELICLQENGVTRVG